MTDRDDRNCASNLNRGMEFRIPTRRDAPELYTVAEISRMVAVPVRTVIRHIHAGYLKAVKLGEQFFATRDDCEAYMKLRDDNPYQRLYREKIFPKSDSM